MAPYFWKRHLREKEQNLLLGNMAAGTSSRVGNAASHFEQHFANGQHGGALSIGHGATHMSQLNRNASATQGGNRCGSTRPLTFQNPCTEIRNQLIFRANGHSRNLSLGARRLHNSNNGGQKTSKRKILDEYAGQSSGSSYAEGSSFNPIVLDDSENSLNDSGNQTDSDQISSSGQPFASLDNGSTGCAFTPLTNMGVSNPEVETLMPHLKVIKEHIEKELNKGTAHFTAQTVPSQSVLSVGIGRGASSRSANPSNVIRSEQGGTKLAETSKRMSKELLKRHEQSQQLTQSSRNGNIPTTAHVPVAALHSRTKTGTTSNVTTGRTSSTGHGFSTGHSTAEVPGRSAVAAGTTIHSRTNDHLEETLSSDPSLPVFLFVGKARASNGNNHTLPVPRATLPPRPGPVPALHGQVREHVYHSTTSKDTWPLPMTVAGTYGRGTRQPETVSGPRQGGRLGISLLSTASAAGNNRRASELELASYGIRTGQHVQAEDAEVLEHSSEMVSETEDEDAVVLEHSSKMASETEDEDTVVLEHLSVTASETEDEDAAVLEHSSEVALETENEVDTLRDMRLDVDDMTYEELLELQDQIGNVSTGLTVNDAKKRVKLRKYVHSREETVPCCICQEEYQPGKMIGRLMRCGHSFHPPCIRKWLVEKNICPICKTATTE